MPMPKGNGGESRLGEILRVVGWCWGDARIVECRVGPWPAMRLPARLRCNQSHQRKSLASFGLGGAATHRAVAPSSVMLPSGFSRRCNN